VQAFEAGPRNHGGVVGAQGGGWHDKFNVLFPAGRLQRLAQREICGDPACGHKGRWLVAMALCVHLKGMPATVGHGVADGGLKRCGEVSNVLIVWCTFKLEGGLAHGGFQAGEREVASRTPLEGARQRKPFGIPSCGGVLNGGPAGKTEPEQLGRFVEGFPDCIVDGGSEQVILAQSGHGEQLAMPTRHQQQEIGEGHTIGQPRRQGVGFKMVDGNEWQAARRSDGLGGHAADMNATDQSGAGGGGNAVHCIKPDPGLVQRAGND
jgi:hypothetical protein